MVQSRYITYPSPFPAIDPEESKRIVKSAALFRAIKEDSHQRIRDLIQQGYVLDEIDLEKICSISIFFSKAVAEAITEGISANKYKSPWGKRELESLGILIYRINTRNHNTLCKLREDLEKIEENIARLDVS